MEYNSSMVLNGSAQGLIVFQRVAYMPVFIFGLILNISALWCFTQSRQWTDTHIYMLNLLFADLLLTIFLPFRIYETFSPMAPTKFCTFLILVHYLNMYASIFIITAISIHRFVVVRLEKKTCEASRKKIAIWICALIWILDVTICIIFKDNMYPDKLKTCYERDGNKKMMLEFLLVLEILGYLLPIILIMTCSSQTIWMVLKSLKDNREHMEEEFVFRRNSVVAIITANMLVFIVCFTPIHAGYLLRHIYDESCKFVHHFYDVSEWLATTNCCFDSVGYYFLLRKVLRGKN